MRCVAPGDSRRSCCSPGRAQEDDAELDLPASLPLTIPLPVVLLGCLVYAASVRHPSRVLALALGIGVLYVVTAGLMKVVTGQLRLGLDELFLHPVVYIVAVIGSIGFLLSQNAFRQGQLVSPAVAMITSTDPVVGVLIGVGWLGEQLDSSPALLAGQCHAALVVIGSIAVITARGSLLLRQRLDPPVDAAPSSAQKTLECEAQYPWPAHLATFERFTVGRERAHSTGVESTTQTGSVHRSVSAGRPGSGA
ncbi:hypothetical protein GCM10010464_54220 [Pseudonocardia yunnanensis]|uniref:EamA domain-containing protein n=1 Tax=Pseudonocardia yunnanensis TaxID=58107 RepID=A0ABW4F7V0_9PSEU